MAGWLSMDCEATCSLRSKIAQFGMPCLEKEDAEIPVKTSAASHWLDRDAEEASSEPTTGITTRCLTEEAEEGSRASSEPTNTTAASWLTTEAKDSVHDEVVVSPMTPSAWLALEIQVDAHEAEHVVDVVEEVAEVLDSAKVEEVLEVEDAPKGLTTSDVACALETTGVAEPIDDLHTREETQAVEVCDSTETQDPADAVVLLDAAEIVNRAEGTSMFLESEAMACQVDGAELEDVLEGCGTEELDTMEETLDPEAAEAAAAAAAEAAEAAEAKEEAYDNAECEFPEEAEEAELAEVPEFAQELPISEEAGLATDRRVTVTGGTAAEIEAALGVVPSSGEYPCGADNSGKLLLMMLKGTRAAPQPPGAEGAIPAVLTKEKWEPLLRPFCDVSDPKHFAGPEQFGPGRGVQIAGSGTQPVVLKDLPNAGLMFMYKPSGWATCSTPQWEGVEGNLIRWVWQRQNCHGANPCHRLDRGTSGAVICATSRNALRHIATQITGRTLVKQYFALCRGQIDPPQGALSVPLALSCADKPLGACAVEGRTAVTRYRVLGYFRRAEHIGGICSTGSMIYSFVQLQIDHGRQHQIRLHMASINHPIVFDAKYSASCLRDDARVCTRLFLHAAYVQCTLPPEGAETLQLACRLPAQLKHTLTVSLRRDRNLEASLQPEAVSLCECLLDPEPSSSSDSTHEVRLAARRRDEFLRSFHFSRMERDEVIHILSRLPTAEERSSALYRFRVLGDRTPDFIVTRFEKYVDGLLKQKYQGSRTGSVDDSAQLARKGSLGLAASFSSKDGSYGPVSMHTENVTCEVCGGQEKMEFVQFPLLNLRLSCRLAAAPMAEPLARLLRSAAVAQAAGASGIVAGTPPPPPPGPPPPLKDCEDRPSFHWQEVVRHDPCSREDHLEKLEMFENGASHPKERRKHRGKLETELIEFLQAHGKHVNGPVVASEFASRYNACIRGDSKRNDGSFRKWIGDQPGVTVEHCGGNRWKVHLADDDHDYYDYEYEGEETEESTTVSEASSQRRRRKR